VYLQSQYILLCILSVSRIICAPNACNISTEVHSCLFHILRCLRDLKQPLESFLSSRHEFLHVGFYQSSDVCRRAQHHQRFCSKLQNLSNVRSVFYTLSTYPLINSLFPSSPEGLHRFQKDVIYSLVPVAFWSLQISINTYPPFRWRRCRDYNPHGISIREHSCYFTMSHCLSYRWMLQTPNIRRPPQYHWTYKA